MIKGELDDLVELVLNLPLNKPGELQIDCYCDADVLFAKECVEDNAVVSEYLYKDTPGLEVLRR